MAAAREDTRRMDGDEEVSLRRGICDKYVFFYIFISRLVSGHTRFGRTWKHTKVTAATRGPTTFPVVAAAITLTAL